jgi:hypothetical protein
MRATESNVLNPLDLRSMSTATTLTESIVSGTFIVLNIPPTIVFVVLESRLPHSMTPRMREVVVFAAVTVAVLGWWWFLALITRRARSIDDGISQS